MASRRPGDEGLLRMVCLRLVGQLLWEVREWWPVSGRLVRVGTARGKCRWRPSRPEGRGGCIGPDTGIELLLLLLLLRMMMMMMIILTLVVMGLVLVLRAGGVEGLLRRLRGEGNLLRRRWRCRRRPGQKPLHQTALNLERGPKLLEPSQDGLLSTCPVGGLGGRGLRFAARAWTWPGC